MRKHKKGFTIVELVIVIAVIAVLTAVLVPTFIHLSSKAKDSIDKTVVKNANIQLAAKEGLEGKNRSMSDAVKDVDEIGYHIPGVETGNGNKIVWDSVADRFVLLDKDNEVMLKDSSEVAPHSKLFKAVSNLDDREDFAVYAKTDYSGTTEFTSPISFDAGDKEDIEAISYEFTTSGEVLVATNSADTVLTVKCPNAEFVHAGLAAKQIINEVKGDTFNEHGKVGFVQIDSGHYVANQGSNIKAVYLTDDAAKVDRENGGVIENAYGASSAVKNENHNVELVINADISAVEDAAIDAFNHDVRPEPTPTHDLTPEDIAAKEQGNKLKVNSSYYASWSAAGLDFTVAQSKVVKLLDNVAAAEFGLLAGASIDLNLNGFSLVLAKEIFMVEGTTLTVRDCAGDGGMWQIAAENLGYGLLAVDGTLNIYGGTFDATGFDGPVVGFLGSASTVNVYGGKFIAAQGNACIGGLKNINIEGGTFNATATGSSVFGFRESDRTVDYSKATIVPGSTIYKA